MLLSGINGFLSAAALIIAIGAQNAFVLAQGVRRTYHWPVAITCMVIDALLISLGMLGGAALIAQWPEVLQLCRIAGAVFLLGYGYRNLRAFFVADALRAGVACSSLSAALLTTLAVSLLNPHVYLDTVVLLGSIGNQLSGTSRYAFWLGAVLASLVWFSSLTWLARLLAPWLGQAHIWRWVELGVALTMWGIAGWLIVGTWR